MLAARLIDSFDRGDQAAFEACAKQQTISFLDNDVAALARRMRVTASASSRPRAPDQPSALAGVGSGGAAAQAEPPDDLT